jgi:hypothetical protein
MLGYGDIVTVTMRMADYAFGSIRPTSYELKSQRVRIASSRSLGAMTLTRARDLAVCL